MSQSIASKCKITSPRDHNCLINIFSSSVLPRFLVGSQPPINFKYSYTFRSILGNLKNTNSIRVVEKTFFFLMANLNILYITCIRPQKHTHRHTLIYTSHPFQAPQNVTNLFFHKIVKQMKKQTEITQNDNELRCPYWMLTARSVRVCVLTG